MSNAKDRCGSGGTVRAGWPDVRLAAAPEQYEASFRMAYDAYRALGFAPFSTNGLRVTPQHLKPTSAVFCAYRSGELSGTISLFEDDGDLPSAAGWAVELDRLRRRRRRIFELGALMVRPGEPCSHRVWLALFKHAWIYARAFRRADALCAFVVARHVPFYCGVLGFRRFGADHFHDCNGLAVAGVAPVYLPLDGAEERFRRRFQHWGGHSRNLYRYFVEEDRGGCEGRIAEGLRNRNRAFVGLQRRFAPFLQQPAAAAALEG